MEIFFYLLLILFLLLLNAFFVLAEFAAVKTRPTQMEVFAADGNRRAGRVRHIQTHLDEYLSVCQVGITLTSIGLGFLGEPAFARLIQPVVVFVGAGAATTAVAHSIAVTAGYLLISFLHIVIGELVPKSLAIRASVKSALFIAYPISFFRVLFSFPIWLLNTTANAVLWLIRAPAAGGDDRHTEDEVRVILEKSQSGGAMSFRRLLHMENILDLGDLSVRNAMRPRRLIRSLRTADSPGEIRAVIAQNRYSRYPLLTEDADNPVGFIHVKDLFLAGTEIPSGAALAALARPCIKAGEQEPLEKTLSIMQRKGSHICLVYDKGGAWIGMVTLEDAVEEVIGTIEEEFPLEPPLNLSNFLSPERIVMDVEGASIIAAARGALARLSPKELPLKVDEIMPYIIERERLSQSYVGHGLAIPHARLPISASPVVVVARMKKPIPAPTTVASETIRFLVILLTPADQPRIHQVLLSHVAGMFESEFFENRINEVVSAEQLFNVISTAEQTVLA